jgi:hypothetical protein
MTDQTPDGYQSALLVATQVFVHEAKRVIAGLDPTTDEYYEAFSRLVEWETYRRSLLEPAGKGEA